MDQSQSANEIANSSITARNRVVDGKSPGGVTRIDQSIAAAALATNATITRNICQLFAPSKTFGMAFMASADSRQLFAAQHVDDAVAADAALQNDGTAGSFFDIPDAD